jgi:hypothetical protein
MRSLRDTTGAGEGDGAVLQGFPGGERGSEEERGGGELRSEYDVCRLAGRERGGGWEREEGELMSDEA